MNKENKEEKKYNMPDSDSETQNQNLSEPVASYDVAKKTYPCQFTEEELIEIIKRSRKDFEAGIFYDAEEVMKDWDKWVED